MTKQQLVSRQDGQQLIPFIDLAKVNSRFEFQEALGSILDSGQYILGQQVETFENEYARYIGVPNCIAVANGLDALRLTLRSWVSLGLLRPSDEVIVPANSFVASALAVSDSGLRLRFADVDPDSFNLTVEKVESAITPKTRVVMAVHLYGRIADAEAIRSLCDERNLLLLEDAAQAHGATLGHRRAGAFGEAAAFSFYPTKNLGALGDAGCVLTKDPAVAKRVRTLANYGSAHKYQHEFLGANSRMSEIQAAVLRLKLPMLDSDNHRRREIAKRYRDGIHNIYIDLPQEPSPSESHVWHIFAVKTKHRDALITALARQGVATAVHYPCAIHKQPAYRSEHALYQAPISEGLQESVLSLPISPVMTNQEVDRVIALLNSWRPSA